MNNIKSVKHMCSLTKSELEKVRYLSTSTSKLVTSQMT